MAFEILDRIDRLSPANLTIREQTRLAENPNDLRWRAIAPRVDANGIKISQLSGVDFRPVADFREWNADGREIPEVLGPLTEMEMVPITATHRIGEKRLTELRMPNPSIQQLLTDGIVADVDRWPTLLADAVDRRIEKTFFQGWSLNQFTVMDPKTGSTITVSLGFSSSRYITEATIWSDAGTNAYDRLLFHLGEAQRLMGSVGAVRMRRAPLNEVVKDAPTGNGLIRPTVANIADRLSEEGFGQITIIVDERTHDAWTDGGSAYSSTPYIATGRVLFQPANGIVGRTHFAPVVRAYDHVARDQRANLRDVVVFHSPQNNGKNLLIEAEAIAFPLPDEQFTYVVNAGV